MFDLHAEVALRLPLDRTFTYLVPEEFKTAAAVGKRVQVVFNKRREEGIVTELHNREPEYEELALEKIIDPEPIVTERQIELARWIGDFYLSGIGESLFKMFPAGKRRPKPGAPFQGDPALIAGLRERLQHDLNDEQRRVFDAVRADLDALPQIGAGNMGIGEGAAASSGDTQAAPYEPPVHLVHGVTGSGKTEIYMHLIVHALEHGRSAILLVPEISLTVQMIRRLEAVFGEYLALLHSGLRGSQRLAGYVGLLRKEKVIAVGTRSAIFSPVEKPGLIILDEEHDGSYKENSAPRYHARQIAHRRAQEEGAVIVLGSATPAVESFYFCRRGTPGFHYHRLESRATGAELPPVRTVKLKDPDIPVTGDLIREIEANIKRGEQTLLLLNRRGFFPFQYCPSCEVAVNCPNCSVALNLHKDGRLVCHYCGYHTRDSGRCPRCDTPTRRLGSGTQKLEEYLINLYPEIRLERLDTDVARSGEVVRECIERLLAGQIDLLVGTQMIAKGLDAPNVTLVGVLQSDLGLSMPDFRAGERTFALLTQVAGRAGRGQLKGRVYFEAMNPTNRVLTFAARQDYDAFVQEELGFRRQALYPPFRRIVRLLFRSEREEDALQSAEALARELRTALEFSADGRGGHDSGTAPDPLLLGPAPAPIAKINNQYRHHIVIKTNRLKKTREALREILPAFRRRPRTHLEVDFDPVDLL